MFHLFICALLFHAAYSYTPCQDGVDIISKETKNPADLIGNWTYVYHWDNLNKFKREFLEPRPGQPLACPEISIAPITMEFVQSKKAECGSGFVPFDWYDARLRLDAPLMKMKDGIIFIGEKDNWLMLDCKHMVKVIMKKVSDDYVVMVNPDIAHISEMISRKPPTLEELKCIAHNVDAGKGMSGFGLCY